MTQSKVNAKYGYIKHNLLDPLFPERGPVLGLRDCLSRNMLLNERSQFTGTPEEFSNPQCQSAGRAFEVAPVLGTTAGLLDVVEAWVSWPANESFLNLVEAACLA